MFQPISQEQKRMYMPNTALQFISFLHEFVKTSRSRISKKLNKEPAALLSTNISNHTLWLEFGTDKVKQTLAIPVPEVGSNGNVVITTQTGVQRAVGTWMVGAEEKNFWGLVCWMLCDRVENYFPTTSKRIYLERLLLSFNYDQAPMVFRNFQRMLDDIINSLPLVGTAMETWAMCNRIQIMDPVWESLTPKQKLAYQKKLNTDMFPMTSLGQSDSGMCNNTLLKVDVRKTVPYGMSHHNPRRNLYQTLGMEGEETPVVYSHTEKDMEEQGLVRKGWNLMTVFLDLPLNFEDQIIVSNRLASQLVKDSRRFVCYGNVVVKPQDRVYFMHPLSIEPDGSVTRFTCHSDSAEVESIEDSLINFNGDKAPVKIVTVTMKRVFKDGFKLTNRHGNKGIIKLDDTGVVHDPVRGDVPVDIIVSARSVQKRKNFGQLLEALTTLLHGTTQQIVVPDNIVVHSEMVKTALVKKGYANDGTVPVTTKWGNFNAVSGWVHWGVIKTPEDQVWSSFDTRATNNKDLRMAGNKFSHIEVRALITMFGKNNPVLAEILSHRQGHDIVFEYLKVLETLRGRDYTLPIVGWDTIQPVDQSHGFFHNPAELTGSVADTSVYPGGFFFSLPEGYRYVIRSMPRGEFSEEYVKVEDVGNTKGAVVLDKIMVPGAKVRTSWQHQTGKFGLSDVSALINSIVSAIHRFHNKSGDAEQIGRAIYMYFHGLSSYLSTKTGAISSLCMAVRYPWTSKATAAVSDSLPANEIEIHETMAKDLKVHTGGFVLVERYPCLGFMSLRVQKVRVTKDPQCRFVVRVSGNSLASQTLDFDGDVIYLMSFHTPEAVSALAKEFDNPHRARKAACDEASEKKVPSVNQLSLDEYHMEIFPPLTAEQNAEIVEGLTGIKRGTGTIVALCYNIMRILEREIGYKDEELTIGMEKLLDKVANSVFSMKHAGRSLETECREAICTANVEKMVELGFDPNASAVLAATILKLAEKFGFDHEFLKTYFEVSEKEGKSSIINIIVRERHKVWFTSRSDLHPVALLGNLDTNPEDLAGWMFKYAKLQWEVESGNKLISSRTA